MATIRSLDDNTNRTAMELKRSNEEITGKKGRISELESLLLGELYQSNRAIFRWVSWIFYIFFYFCTCKFITTLTKLF